MVRNLLKSFPKTNNSSFSNVEILGALHGSIDLASCYLQRLSWEVFSYVTRDGYKLRCQPVILFYVADVLQMKYVLSNEPCAKTPKRRPRCLFDCKSLRTLKCVPLRCYSTDVDEKTIKITNCQIPRKNNIFNSSPVYLRASLFQNLSIYWRSDFK